MYCTPEDVREVIPIIDTSTMADPEMEKFIKRASNWVDAKLRDLYIVPFNPVPEVIKDITSEYAGYLVLRTIFSTNTPNETDQTKALKDSAKDQVKDIRKGEMSLNAPMVQIDDEIPKEAEKVFTMEDITPITRG